MPLKKLKFQADWRLYQARILHELETHLNDNHLHVVAAPGSGKTILGLEVMRRIGHSTVILAPTITIRNQWMDRLVSMFLPKDEAHPDWISQDIKNPKFLTIITYQALHAAFSGTDEQEEPRAATTKKPKIADIITQLAQLNVKTIILDEAHHLRNEWWKALTKLKKGLQKPTIVSLTATPPYDVDANEWQKYQELCGPVDSVISVPELVKNGDLCPHQDYVYFSLPTKLEKEKLKQFKKSIAELIIFLKNNTTFMNALSAHPWVYNTKEHIGEILQDPKFFSSLIIFLNAAGYPPPRYALDILGVGHSRIPTLDPQWLETLLTGILYTHAKYLDRHERTLEAIRTHLKRIGAIERSRVIINNTKEIKKLLTRSLGKLDSIADITRMEADHLNENLRMVILTDYIRKSELPVNAFDLRPMDKIGVIPIFEYLRRKDISNVKLGILTGSLVFIPKTSRTIIEKIAPKLDIDVNHIHYEAVKHDENYISVSIKGEHKQKIVHLITELFNAGGITVLIGTQALLGEGWDAPSLNTLILASVVGSYMLSNQMRGRAIRTNSDNPDKVANIWHLVGVDIETQRDKLRFIFTGQTDRQKFFHPFDEIKEDLGPDILMLRRRFRAFEGLSYQDPPLIENGFKRLNLGKMKWTESAVTDLNQQMLQRARERERLPELWDKALLGSSPRPEMREKIESNYAPQGFAFENTIKSLTTEGLISGAIVGVYLLRGIHKGSSLLNLLLFIFGITFIVALPKLVKALYLLVRHGTLENSIEQVGWAVLETLHHMKLIERNLRGLRIETAKNDLGVVFCRLDGASPKERKYFLEAMLEVLGPVENPRYLLTHYSYLGRLLRVNYHPVPTIIGQKKSHADFFTKCWNRRVGSVDLIYTKNVEGRITLLQARTQSFSAAFQKKTDRISVWE
ncbi:DEAD/DEAH box helicase family protein [Thalassospira sp. TSL5-1]|uniref:DEAD/DEAH box helicase family protein n=1 Tax=Thalassospira sp. TSL5-1 TaxID=1544451 RepID=UPI00093D08FE|nr:DEAD/DEAH box helicase family protein [Thalassospira sp. TSL5-1]OKH87136.1 hypothetical protein LF95_19360 [Thalassospira sp. TSL5-1]